MTSFQHILILVSIVIGLALADVLTSLHNLVMARERVRFHWLPMAWALLLFVAATQYWWAFFQTGRDPAWSHFFAFLFVLLELVALYLIASSALPDVTPDQRPIDLEAHYFDTRFWFFGLIALYVALLVIDRLIRGNPLWEPVHGFHATGIVLALILMWSEDTRVHAAITGITAAVFFAFVLRYTLRIQ